MSSKSIRVALLFAVSVCVFFAYSQLNVQAQTLPNRVPSSVFQQWTGLSTRVPSSPSDILYTQPLNSGGILYQSSQSGSSADEYVWDGFTIQTTQVLTQVEWIGGYNPLSLGSGGPVQDFAVTIYASLSGGSQPDLINPPLANYLVGGNAGETPAGTVGGVPMYNYSFTLPVSFTVTGGTKYWLQIEAAQAGSPSDWGWAAGLGGDSQHFRRYTPNVGDIRYQLAPGDAAFTLLGLPAPIGGLSATNDSPTALGRMTTFTATVATGSGISYTWNYGDQMTGSGRVVTHTYAAVGKYAAVVTATNSLGSVTAATPVTITDAPIAGLTAINDSPTMLGNITGLTATIASGSNVNYEWNFGNGALGHRQEVTYTYATIGFYTAMVTATNSTSVVTATTPITIFGAMPLAHAGPDQTVRTGDKVTLDGSGSFAPPGHLPLTYFWKQVAGATVVLSSNTISRPTFFAPTAPTILTFTLVVTDVTNLASEPDQVRIDVVKHYIYLPLIRRD